MVPSWENTEIDSGRASEASDMFRATSALGNTTPLQPNDIPPVRLSTPVAADRPNGPMLTTNLRRDSALIPENLKMPSVDAGALA